MTEERKVALRVVAHYVDCMSYWEDDKAYYVNPDKDIDEDKVHEEVHKIMKQIINRYDLNRSFI